MQMYEQNWPVSARTAWGQHRALRLWGRMWPWLLAEGRALTSWRFLALLALFVLLLGLVGQQPFAYVIDVGHEEGYLSDLPMLSGFNTAESDIHGSFRWTRDAATITLPGLGQRPVVVELTFFPINAAVVEAGPDVIDIWSHDQHLAQLPVRAHGGKYTLGVPAYRLADGTLQLTIRTDTFSPPGDPRQLGTPLGLLRVTSAKPRVLVLPDWGALLAWTLAVVLAWATLMRLLGRDQQGWATGFLAGALLLIMLAATLDAPRWAFGAKPALIATTLGYLLAVLLRPLLGWLAARFALPYDARTLGWLTLIVVVAFGLRYGGRLYPRSMHGDIGFHTNRLHDTALGTVYLLSRNRGVDFPYPSGPYIMVAPFLLTGIATPDLIQVSATLVDSLGAVLVYALVVLARRDRAMSGSRSLAQQTVHHIALLAAALYVFTAAGFMTNWWSFSTHIYAQFAALLVITAMVYVGVRTTDAARQPIRAHMQAALVLVVLLSGVFLGHFGFFINVVLLGGGLTALVWGMAWRGSGWAQSIRWPLTLAYIGAGLIAGIFFYSAYLPLFLTQAQAVAGGGLTGLAERAPVTRSYLWRILWQGGVFTHFGFFALLLAPLGLPVLWRWGTSARILVSMVVGSFLVSMFFAVLPFITLSTQSTRWLMFSAWAIAIGAAVTIHVLWRYGRAGRIVVLSMAGFMFWNTAMIWLQPLIWRIRPPEPF